MGLLHQIELVQVLNIPGASLLLQDTPLRQSVRSTFSLTNLGSSSTNHIFPETSDKATRTQTQTDTLHNSRKSVEPFCIMDALETSSKELGVRLQNPHQSALDHCVKSLKQTAIHLLSTRERHQ